MADPILLSLRKQQGCLAHDQGPGSMPKCAELLGAAGEPHSARKLGIVLMEHPPTWVAVSLWGLDVCLCTRISVCLCEYVSLCLLCAYECVCTVLACVCVSVCVHE